MESIHRSAAAVDCVYVITSYTFRYITEEKHDTRNVHNYKQNYDLFVHHTHKSQLSRTRVIA